MKILQICPRVPFPPHDGGAIAMFDVCNGLSKAGNEVTVFAINTPKHHQSNNVLEGKVKRLITVDVNTKISIIKAFINLFKKTPYNFERFIDKKVIEKLTQLLKNESFDVIQIEGAQVAYYIEIIRKITKTPVVLRAHNVESRIWDRLSRDESNPFKKWYLSYLSKGIKWYEHKYLNQFDKIIAITQNDKNLLETEGIKVPIEVVAAGVEFDRIDKKNSISAEKSLLIIGALNWQPNVEGLKWFLENVWSRVENECGGVKLHVAGKNGPKWLVNHKYKQVKYHGFVDSSSDFISKYDLMLVPLLSGSGMRLKIVEGMAHGKAIISTSVGAEGIECTDNKNIFIRDNVDDWVKLICAYSRGKIDTRTISNNAMSFVKEIHDNEIIINQFESIYKILN